MKRILTFVLACLATLSFGDKSRLGIYILGERVGYSLYESKADMIDDKPVTRVDTHTLMNMNLLGQGVQMEISAITWTDANGGPLRMKFDMESAGRDQKLDATFGPKTAVVEIDNSGTKSEKVLPIPEGAAIVDDPMTPMLTGKFSIGTSKTFYVLDPVTVTFLKNTATAKGAATAKVFGKEVSANLIEIKDPRATMSVYVDGKGELVKVEGPMGMEMFPEDISKPLGPPPTTPIDLANASSIAVEPDIEDPNELAELKLDLSGDNLPPIPSGDHQSATKSGNDWIIDIKPQRISDSPGVTIAEAAAMQPVWTKPSMDIPSDESVFTKLARSITKGKIRVRDAALAVRRYVKSIMHPNAGIGVVRNANEVLKSKEGVCRDYAILTTTLLRAAGIPARVASGLECYQNRFYYHAWSEAWDGKRWIGIDSTVDQDQISAGHVQLAVGSVEDAFVFPVLDKAKIRVLAQRRGEF